MVVNAEGQVFEVDMPAGSTAEDAIEKSGFQLELIDKSDPPLYTVLTEGSQVRLIRVVEEFIIEESTVSYTTEFLKNESLPEGEQRLIQAGVNGVQETTIRRVLEDGVEVSRSVVKTVIVTPAQPEIVMIGSQSPFAVLPIEGKLAYISAGNAWIMEENTGFRRPVVTTGDLDGRIFSLSPDGIWILYTRSEEDENIINSLWVSRIDGEDELSFPLEVNNVIHFADWVPGSVNGVVFSTAESNPSPPGWQANNDLQFINFSANGWVSQPRLSVTKSSGGVYGWWGMDFAWSPDGESLAYARPDSVGLVNFEAKAIKAVYDLIPLQTRSDWAWIPEISWSPDGSFIYLVDHVPQEGLTSPEESSLFNLAVLPSAGGVPVSIVTEAGMFAGPSPSPLFFLPNGQTGYKIIFLKAMNPTQSRSSGYELMIMDRDGSNQQLLFPPEGAAGLFPQKLLWEPFYPDNEVYLPKVVFVYQGNLWLYDLISAEAQQITTDGLTTILDWK